MAESNVESLTQIPLDLAEKESIRILHVDDEPGFLKAAKQCLELQGLFQVETAFSVEEALEKMDREDFDAIVCDYVMSGKDGLEFLKELRAKGNRIPFIIFTGKGREEVAIKALNLGADQYLHKSGDPEAVYGELAHGIRRAVERKRAYMELWRREERLRAILTSSPDAIIIGDLHGNVVDCNEAALRLVGFSSKKELVGKSSFELIAEKDRKRAMENLKKTLEDGVTENIEYTLLTVNGEEYVGLLSASVIKDSFGNPTGFVGILRDITERKKAEERLRESEEKYRSLFENAVDVTLTYDLKGNVTSINKAAVEYGFKKDEIIGKNMLKFVPKRYWPRLLKELVQNARGKTLEGQIEINTPAGKKVAQYRSTPILIANKVVGVQTILRDITERKRMKEALRKSEKHARLLLEFQDKLIETAVVWINLLDEEGNITMWNRAAELISGYSRERVIGHKKVWEWLYPDPKYRAQVFAEAKEILEKGKLAENYQTTIRCKDGTLKTISWYSNNILDEKGKLVGSIAIGIDITKTIEAQQRVRESEEKYRSLFENAGDVIATFDLKGNVTSINKAVEEYGYKKDEIIGKNMRNFVSKKNWPRLLKDLTKIARGKPVKGEIALLTPKGKVMAEYRSTPIRQGKKVVGIQIVLRGITERKRFEEKLSALNTYSRSLNTAENMEEIYRLTLNAMEKTLGFENAAFMVVDKDMLCVVGQRGYAELLSFRLPLKGKRGITVKAAKTGRPILVPDTRKEKAFVEGVPDMRSELDVPIKVGNKVLGVLSVESKEVDAFDERDQKLLEILASHAATAMSNLKYAKSLEAYAREIQESQEKFERLFLDNPEAAVYLGSDSHILDANPRFTKLFGYSLEEIKGKHLDDVIVPEHKMEEAKMLDRKGLKGHVFHDTVRKRKDGNLIPVSISAAPIEVEGEIRGYVGVYEDITERKRYEERLSALNTYSRSLNTADSIEEIYRLTLDAMEKSLGFEYAAFMVVDKDMLCVVGQRGYPRALSIKLPLDGSKRGVSVKVATTGKPINIPDVEKEDAWVDFMPGIRSGLDVPIKIGRKVLGVLVVDSKSLNAFNEKDQRLLEILASHAATAMSNLRYARNLEAYAREIRESQEEFKSLFMDNPEAAVYLGPDFHILDVNPRFEELFGHSLDEIKGKHINSVVVPEDRIKEAEMFDKRVSRGEAYQEDTVRKRKDGTLIPVSFSAAPITVENRVIGHLAVYKDISQLKITEKKLRETLEKLERMNEKLRVIGKFTRHDARNKLSMATTNVFLAKQKLTSSHEALEHLSEIESACRQVEGIFDFARIYEQLGAEELAYTDVEKSLAEAAMLFSDLPAVKIVNNCHGLTVLADSLLRQLFYNLIDNSLKHGEKVSQIRVYYEEMGKDKLKLVYEDDGVGIPKAEKEKIFQEGYGKGTGYGLYLIRKICEVYGWIIRETGRPGKGAQFIIIIPRTGERRR
jgi:PAS domain S-box-containing protein